MLQKFSQNHDETDEQFAQPQQQLRDQLNHKSMREQDHFFIILQSHNSLMFPVINQVSAQGDTDSAHVQRSEPDIQQVIRILPGGELPANHTIFKNQQVKKLNKRQKRLEVVSKVQFRNLCNHLRNEQHKQILVPEATMATKYQENR